jgi:hypothetical protein
VAGEGSKMTKAAIAQGILGRVAAVFPGDTYNIEQILTRIGASKFCPICVTEEYNLKPIKKIDKNDLERSFNCPRCKARPNEKCKGPSGGPLTNGLRYHLERSRVARRVLDNIQNRRR